MAQKVEIFENYFDYTITLMKMSLLYKDNTTKPLQRLFQIFYSIFWYLILICYFLSTVIFAILNYHTDYFLKSVRDIFNQLALFFKAVHFFIMQKEIVNIMDKLRFGDYNYENYADFQPVTILNKGKNEAITWTRNFWKFCIAICTSMFFSGVLIFTFAGDQQYVLENGKQIYKQKQPVDVQSPFGSGTRSRFMLTLIYTVVSLMVIASTIVTLNSIFITIMSCVSSHLDVLQGAFRTITPRCKQRLKAKTNKCLIDREMDYEINKCIRHLQTVLNAAEDIERVYFIHTLYQAFTTLSELCVSLYYLSQPLNENSINESIYMMSVIFELLIYCRFGNSVTEASLKISFAVYETDWYKSEKSFRQKIRFIMTRMQKPIYITIGKLCPLNFETFLNIVRSAYSAFTFLKQRNDTL